MVVATGIRFLRGVTPQNLEILTEAHLIRDRTWAREMGREGSLAWPWSADSVVAARSARASAW